jgi:predicted GNAT family N-acyltransferase
MTDDDSAFVLRLARDDRDLRAAQRLRYRVFVQELGADGPLIDHDGRLEIDAFDPHFDHLLLIDTRRDAAHLDDVVGAYRLLPSDRMVSAGRFYSESEYDLTALKSTGRKLVELGRSCVHPAYRGGSAMLQLWNALAAYVLERDIEILFGAASFHGRPGYPPVSLRNAKNSCGNRFVGIPASRRARPNDSANACVLSIITTCTAVTFGCPSTCATNVTAAAASCRATASSRSVTVSPRRIPTTAETMSTSMVARMSRSTPMA